jgi:hypothetical protein
MGQSTKRRRAEVARSTSRQITRWQVITTVARLAAVILQLLDDYLSGRPGRFL